MASSYCSWRVTDTPHANGHKRWGQGCVLHEAWPVLYHRARVGGEDSHEPDNPTYMSLPLKLISTDFDGTLFAEFENPPIPQRFVSLITDLQARGVKWVINTGRDMSSLMEALARARISVQPDYLVLVEREIYQHDGVRYAPVERWNAACTQDHAELFELVRPEVSALTDWVNRQFRA